MPRARIVHPAAACVRLVAVAAVAAVGLSACSATNEITTKRTYNASDGITLRLGSSIAGQNLLVLTSAKGAPGVLTGALTNSGSTDTVVTVTVEGTDPATVPVAAGATVLLKDASIITLTTVPAAPGATVPVTLSAGTEGTDSAPVPVLDGTEAAYKDLVPAG